MDFYDDLEMSSVLTNRETRLAIRTANSIMLTKYVENWKSVINEMPKLRTYKTLKSSFGTEPYVKSNISRKARSVLAKLRNGSFPINIELGRYRGLPLERRICPLCKEGVEDELHFLCVCPTYQESRTLLYNKLDLNDSSDEERLIILLSDGQNAKYTAKFVIKAYEMRSGRG